MADGDIYQPQVAVNQQYAQQNLQGATNSAKSVAGNHGTDPAYVQTRENFSSMSLDDMVQSAEQMDPGSMHDVGRKVADIGSALEMMALITRTRAQSAMSGAWTGGAADKLSNVIDVLGKATGQGGTVVSSVAGRIQAAAFGADALKTAMPQGGIPGMSAVTAASAVTSPAAALNSYSQEEAQRQQAITAMNNIYSPTYWPAGDGVPSYTPPPQVGSVGPGATNNYSGGTGGVGSTGPGAANQNNSGGQQQPSQPGPGENAPGSHNGPNDASNANGSNASQSPGGKDPNSTTAAGADGGGFPGSGLPGAGLGSGGGLGGVGGPGGVGGGLGGGGSVPLADPTLAGGPATARAALAAEAAAARAGAAGMPGMGMPPGGKKGKDEEKVHAIKPYLINMDNTNELLGADQTATPPVLGAQLEGRPKPDAEEPTRREDSGERS